MSKKFNNEGHAPETAETDRQKITAAAKPVGEPGFNGNLPHSSKKVSLGPNTKR